MDLETNETTDLTNEIEICLDVFNSINEYAAKHEIEELWYIESLLDNEGIKPNTIIIFNEETSVSMLAYSVTLNEPKLAEIFLKYGADPDLKDKKGRAPLIYAVLTGKEITKILLKYGADPNTTDPHGRTPLMFSIMEPYVELEILKDLIRAGADLNIQDDKGMTALMWAVIGRDRSSEFLFSGLIRTGGFRAEGWQSWCTLALLYIASEREIQLETVKLLLNNGANKNLVSKSGMTALTHAITNNDDEIINILTGLN